MHAEHFWKSGSELLRKRMKHTGKWTNALGIWIGQLNDFFSSAPQLKNRNIFEKLFWPDQIENYWVYFIYFFFFFLVLIILEKQKRQVIQHKAFSGIYKKKGKGAGGWTTQSSQIYKNCSSSHYYSFTQKSSGYLFRNEWLKVNALICLKSLKTATPIFKEGAIVCIGVFSVSPINPVSLCIYN